MAKDSAATKLGDNLVIIERPAGDAPAGKDPAIIKLENELAGFEETLRQIDETTPEIEEQIATLRTLCAGVDQGVEAHPRHDRKGRPIPGGDAHRLKLAEERLAALEGHRAAAKRAIEAKQAELDHLRAEAARTLRGPVRDLERAAMQACSTSDRVDRAAQELRDALRELHADELAFAELAGSDRARRALSLASLRQRMGCAFVTVGMFDVNPNSAGPRGLRAFIDLERPDPTSDGVKMVKAGGTFSDINERHYLALIREICR